MKARLCFALSILAAVALGCGSPNAPAMLSGKITYNNNPVTGGTISLQPSEPGPLFSQTIGEDGTYRIPDVAPGTYEVSVNTESLNPDRKVPTYGGGNSPAPANSTGAGPAAAPPGKYVKIDPKYANPKQSGLTVTVAPGGGKQTKDFPLTGP